MHGGQQRILVVDDDDVVRDHVADVLERHGFETVGADSGADALAFLAVDAPALVLLDLQMSDMNGWEVLGAMRAEPRLRRVPVVVMSGEPRASLPQGVRAIPKPVETAMLLAVVRDVARPAPRA